MKVAVITCYKDPDYVRARVLRAAFKQCKGVQLRVVKNSAHGPFRYIEVFYKLVRLRLVEKPNVYVLTFRGYEILPFVLLIAGRKPVIYDEFINPIEWAVFEHGKLKQNGVLHKLLRRSYHWLANKARIILADTPEHATLSAQLNKLNIESYKAVPVGIDETLFKPARDTEPRTKKPFTVFFYGNMLPLHGLDYLLSAAQKLQDPSVHFIIAGGNKKIEQQIKNIAVESGISIEYRPWIAFEELPTAMKSCSLFIGGPLGKTTQSDNVVTGKTVQALACAVPCIVGRNKSSNMFVDKNNCLLVSQANSASLAEAIRWAQHNQAELTNIGLRGRKLFEKEFSTQKISLLLGDVLDEVVEHAVAD